ncbi:hypothetical protein ACMFMF_011260 [Clarireedia jacksonii]
MPMDEREMERIDMAHEKYYLLLDQKRFLAPIDPNLQRVLDLGCGTGRLRTFCSDMNSTDTCLGIWSIDFADDHPSAEVIGVDIASIQPRWAPPNCQFQVDDITMPWTWHKDMFDFIFLRDLTFSIRDWPALIRQCYDHLKPGGWVEFESILGTLGCDDDTVPPDSKHREYDKYIREAARLWGTPVEDVASFKKWFEEAGFEAVVEKRYKIPSNPWPEDPRLKLIGAYELKNFLIGLEGMSIRGLKGLGWTYEEITVFLDAVKEELKDRRRHSYHPFYAVYGRKPEAKI